MAALVSGINRRLSISAPIHWRGGHGLLDMNVAIIGERKIKKDDWRGGHGLPLHMDVVIVERKSTKERLVNFIKKLINI